tara:strand:+ start:19158 stop:19328 length:171 start_codon:yes stop_codon:yes gene_type:complete
MTPDKEWLCYALGAISLSIGHSIERLTDEDVELIYQLLHGLLDVLILIEEREEELH